MLVELNIQTDWLEEGRSVSISFLTLNGLETSGEALSSPLTSILTLVTTLNSKC